MQVMKEDIQRAGYDGSNGYSIKLSGASNTIQVSGGVAVGFVYFRQGSSDNKIIEISFTVRMVLGYKYMKKGTLVSDDLTDSIRYGLLFAVLMTVSSK